MLVIRLRRIGRKSDPHYRIVVAEHTAPVQGKFIAEIGHYHPKSKELVIEHDHFLGWLERGAKPSNTVAKLAEKSGLAHQHIVVKQYHTKPKKKAAEAKTAQAEASPKKTQDEVNPVEVETTDSAVDQVDTIDGAEDSDKSNPENASETDPTAPTE
jgi:small subunit ribosomal protein S16